MSITRGRQLLAGAVTTALLAAAAVGAWWWLQPEPAPAAADEASGSIQSTPAEPPGQAQQISDALAELPQNPQAFVADGAADFVAGRADAAIPRSATLSADPETWSPDGVGGGVITATLTTPGGQTVRYMLVLELDEEQRPRVLGTFPLDPPATTEDGQ